MEGATISGQLAAKEILESVERLTVASQMSAV